VPQIRELLSNYGPVAVLWFDTPVGMNTARAEKIMPLLKLQPEIVVNNRLDAKKLTGDFMTPEQRIPPTGIPGKDWETCMTMNRTWGFRSADTNWKSAETLITNLVDIASKGGNYLLNVGPTSAGEIPQASVERLIAIGKWMKVNGQAIYGTTASPFPTQLPWGRCTQKPTWVTIPLLCPRAATALNRRHEAPPGTTLYLHVFGNDWPKDGKLVVPGLMNPVVGASLLEPNRFGSQPRLETARVAASATTQPAVVISVPETAPDKISTTVVLKIKGTPQIDAAPALTD